MSLRRLVEYIALGLFALALLDLMSGCAPKQHAKLPLRPGVEVEFRGVRDGHCHVADVQYDAKEAKYVAICATKENP